MVSQEQTLLIKKVLTIQGHCGNVKGQTMLSTRQLYSGYKD